MSVTRPLNHASRAAMLHKKNDQTSNSITALNAPDSHVVLSVADDGRNEEEACGDGTHDKPPSPAFADGLGGAIAHTLNGDRVRQARAIADPVLVGNGVFAETPYPELNEEKK